MDAEVGDWSANSGGGKWVRNVDPADVVPTSISFELLPFSADFRGPTLTVHIVVDMTGGGGAAGGPDMSSGRDRLLGGGVPP